MKLFFALFLILFLAFSGYHLTFRRIRLPLYARKFYLTGTEFLFLGLLLGPQFLNLLDPATIEGLAPLSALLLGWAGLLFGFQFEITKLRRFPMAYFTAAIVQSVWALGIVFLGTYYVLSAFLLSAEQVKITIALTLAATAACTAQTGMALLEPTSVARQPHTVRLLSYISSMDGLVSLAVFSLVFFYRPQPDTPDHWITMIQQGPVLCLTAGSFLIVLYLLLLAQRRDTGELALAVIGMAIITSGAAAVLNFSPLILNFMVGVALVNLSREKERIFQILLQVEKPVYLMLLVLLGVHWQMTSPWLFLLAMGLCLGRIVGKWMGGALITRMTPALRGYPAHLGFGLLESGGLPLAILFDYHQGFATEFTGPAVSIVLLAVIYNDLISPHFMGKLLGERSDAITDA